MNEQIRELALKSGIAYLSEHTAYLTANDGLTVLPSVSSLEKFAELIVLECVNAVMDGTKEGDHYAMRIEQHFDNGQGGILHFGVEE